MKQLSVRGLTFSYPGGFSIELDETFSGVTGLFGRNASGKTTMLNCLAGILRPDKGEILLAQQSIKASDIGYLPERDYFLPQLTGGENLDFQSFLKTGSKQTWKNRSELVAELDLDRWINEPFQTYSTGTRRKIQLVSSLIGEPPVLIWDEPHNGVDLYSNEIINREILAVKTSGRLMILTSHISEILLKYCDSLIEVSLGKAARSNGLT